MPKLSTVLLICLAAAACGAEKTAQQAFAAGSYETAYRLFQPRAAAGDIEAQNYLGVHYYLGLGVPRDLARALAWYEKAAKQGNPAAQFNYALMFHGGYGTAQDPVAAFMWYYAAYRQGHANAKRYMDVLTSAARLTPNQLNLAKMRVRDYILDPQVGEQAAEGRLFHGQSQ